MTNQQHPITPPPELVQQWLGEYFGCTVSGELSESECYLATASARWGADQELEWCINYFLEYDTSWSEDSDLIAGLRAARRPKPPSLKEQALESLHHLEAGCAPNVDLLRRALEALDD